MSQKTKIVESVLLIFWKYKPKVESISKYKVMVRNAKTIGSNLKGGIRASNKWSSTSVVVFLTNVLTFETINFAKILLISKAKIIEIIMIPKSNKLKPKTPLSITDLIWLKKFSKICIDYYIRLKKKPHKAAFLYFI